MGKILQISAVQPPIYLGSDPSKRIHYSLNFDLTQLLESPIEDVFAGILSAAPLSIPGFNIMRGTDAPPPILTEAEIDDTSPDGPYIRVMSSGGYGSTFARGEVANTSHRQDRPSVQIIVFSLDSALAATTAMSIWKTLNGAKHVQYT